MIILNLTAESNGAHANQTVNGNLSSIPEGWAQIPDNLLPAWEAYKPFVTLTVEDGVITGMADNPEARAAQEAADAAYEPPLDELTLTQLALAELAEAQEAAQTAMELAIAELAEILLGGE